MPVKRAFQYLTGVLRGSAAVVDPPAASAGATPAVPGDGQSGDGPDGTQLQICAEGQVEILAAAGEGPETSGPPRFRLLAYGGGKMRPYGFYQDVVVDLAGCKVLAGDRPVLMSHNPLRPVGHMKAGEIEITDRQIKAQGILSSDNDDSNAIVRSSKNGFPWTCSIGARYERESVQQIEAGTPVQVNGRTLKGPFLLVRKATLYEISFVTIGGDDSARANVSASLTEGTMNFQDWLKANGFDINTLQANQLGTLRAAYKAETGIEAEEVTPQKPKPQTVEASGNSTAPSTPAVPTGGQAASATQSEGQLQAAGGQVDPYLALRAEHGRLRNIDRLVDQATNVPQERRTEIHASAVNDGWDVNRVELELLRAGRAEIGAGGEYAIHTPDRQQRLSPQVITASICASLGSIPDEVIAQGMTEQDMDIAATQGYRNATLHTLMQQCYIAAHGHSYSGNLKSREFASEVMIANRRVMGERRYSSLNAASGFTTLSLTGILGTVAHRMLLAAFKAQATVHQHLCRRSNHTDFRPHETFRLDVNGGYQRVAKDGQLKHSSLSDTGFSSKVETHGTILTLTREDMINDDLDAFSQIPTKLGQMGPKKMEEEFWKMVLGNVGNFFSDANQNIVHGASVLLDIDGLETARLHFLNRVGRDDSPILIEPKVLVAGSNKITMARNLWASENLEISGTNNKLVFKENPHKGLYEPHNSPYINNANIKDRAGNAIPNQSLTKWFLLADPAERAAFVMALLNGQAAPTIESDETDFNTLGMQWRAYHDFGFGFEEPEAAVMVTGVVDPN